MTQREFEATINRCIKILKKSPVWFEYEYQDDFGWIWVNKDTGECLFLPSDFNRDETQDKMVSRAATILGVKK